MNKIAWITVFLMASAVSFSGCQKKDQQVNSPNSAAAPDLQTIKTGFAQIMLNNESDCSKAAAEMNKYIDDNAETWRNLITAEIIKRVDSGEDIADATEATFKFPESIEEALSNNSCLHSDPDVRDSIRRHENEIARKAYEAVEAHYSVNQE